MCYIGYLILWGGGIQDIQWWRWRYVAIFTSSRNGLHLRSSRHTLPCPATVLFPSRWLIYHPGISEQSLLPLSLLYSTQDTSASARTTLTSTSMGTCINILNLMALRVSPSPELCPYVQQMQCQSIGIPPFQIQFLGTDCLHSGSKADIYVGKSKAPNIPHGTLVWYSLSYDKRSRTWSWSGSWRSRL